MRNTSKKIKVNGGVSARRNMVKCILFYGTGTKGKTFGMMDQSVNRPCEMICSACMQENHISGDFFMKETVSSLKDMDELFRADPQIKRKCVECNEALRSIVYKTVNS